MPSFGSPGTFPNEAAVGRRFTHYRKLEPDVDAMMISHEYEDGGRSFNITGTVAPQGWRLEWEGLTKAQADVITAHFNNAWKVYSFNFVDKQGVTQTGLRYTEYERRHNKNVSWGACEFVGITLMKFPA